MVNSREVCWLKRYFNVFHVIFDLCWNQPFVSLLRLHPNLDGFCQLPGLRFPSWKHQEQWHLPERSPHRTQTQSLAMLLGYSNPMKLLAFPTKKWNSTKSCPCKAEFRTQNLELSYLYSVCLISLLFFCWRFVLFPQTHPLSGPVTKFLPKTWLPTRTSCRSKLVANFQRCPSMPGHDNTSSKLKDFVRNGLC